MGLTLPHVVISFSALQTVGHVPCWSSGHILLWFLTREGKIPEGGALQSEVKMAASLRATKAWAWYSQAHSREAISPDPKNPCNQHLWLLAFHPWHLTPWPLKQGHFK